MSALPLTGIKIIDLTRVLAGPLSAQMLGDLGADVIKIERPGQGDDTRKWGPPFVKDTAGNDTSESAYYLAVNRNKRSITLDVAQPEGQAIAKLLIARCDVFAENFKVGDMARYNLAYEQIKYDFPRLIYCSITGFGQSGPYASRAGYDFLAQGMGGVMSVTGDPSTPPQKVGVAVTDIICGIYSVVGILAALQHRHLTGRGQLVDLALLDTQVSWLVPVLGLALVAAVVAYVAGIAGARLLGAKVASFVGLTEVLFAVLFAWLFLGELPTSMQLVGGVLIISGVAVIRLDDGA